MLQIEIHRPKLSSSHAYFHPSVECLSDGNWLMSMQILSGSDFYGCPEYCISPRLDGGWSQPQEIPGLRTKKLSEQLSEGVADLRLFKLPDSRKVLAIGCNTFYTDKGALAWEQKVNQKQKIKEPRQMAVYCVYDEDKGWSERYDLEAECMRDCSNWRVACAQLAFSEDGAILLPVYFETGRIDFHGYASARFSVCVMLARWKNGRLKVEACSNILSHQHLRGFVEPSLYRFQNEYFLTIRAEDGKAYWSRSTDPLHFPEPQAWCFDDGQNLKTDSTQQHWLELDSRLYLVYTRDNGSNFMVPRFRAPLYMARFDERAGVLEKDSELVVLPHETRNGLHGMLGNFHCLSLPDKRALVCDAAAFLRTAEDQVLERHCELWLAEIKAP